MDSRKIVNEHKDLVYHVLHRMVTDRDYHEEIFQEVFLNILEGLPGYRGEAKLSTWIYTVAVRTCLAHRKQYNKHHQESLEERLDRDGWQPTADSETDGAGPRLLRRDLEGALDQVPVKYSLPLALFYLDGRTYTEIGEILDLPIGTVKTNLFRGLRALRNQLGGELHDHI